MLAGRDSDQCRSPGNSETRRLQRGVSHSECIFVQASLTHVHSPYASAGAHIESILWVLHRRKEKLAVEGEVEQVMLQIQSICLALRVDQRH